MSADQPAKPDWPMERRRFVPGAFRVARAADTWEHAAATRLRHQTFCCEQGIFENDRDAIDSVAITIVAETCVLGAPDDVVGTVRIHHQGGGVWWGSRLAVAPDFRRARGLGTALVRMAVCTAHGHDATRFLAHVQIANVAMFSSLHWTALERIEVHGRPHMLMQADLAQYPAEPRSAVIFAPRAA